MSNFSTVHQRLDLKAGLVGVWPPGITRLRTLRNLLGAPCTASPLKWVGVSSFLGKGNGFVSHLIKRIASMRGRSYWCLENGFIGSMQPHSPAPLSLILDDWGSYYNASRPSRLEQMIEQHEELKLGESEAVAGLMMRVVASRITKYNSTSLELPAEFRGKTGRRRVLVVDQRLGAPSVRYGMADEECFRKMLAAAQDENPDAEIWLKAPYNGHRGYLSVADLSPEIRVITADINPFVLIEQVDIVFTVASQLGFEALLAGVPVRVFGMPFYAGWGLTQDEQKLPRRTARPTVAALFDATYVRYPRYLNPATHELGNISDVLQCIELQQAIRRRQADLGPLTGVGFSLWKRPFARPFLEAGGFSVTWRSKDKTAGLSTNIALWGAATKPQSLSPEIRVVRMEDGFIHSTGLGSDLIAPHSQIIDRQGLYFDARGPSDLFDLLNRQEFGPELLQRAAGVRTLLCRTGITKYNLGRRAPNWEIPVDRCVVLVPGQVADDASVRYGSGEVKTAEDLLRAVRRIQPDAYIVYKPHPDVLSGNRQGLIEAQAFCDRVDTQADIISLIEVADEVHTLSSFAGFEALIRGKKVHAYGMPFYAGWGLTEDAIPSMPYRKRRVTLDELVAAALILYPFYWDWVLGIFTTPEAIIGQLAEAANRPLSAVNQQWARPILRGGRWVRNVLNLIVSK